jgi:hypothetical protein
MEKYGTTTQATDNNVIRAKKDATVEPLITDILINEHLQ